MQGKHSCVRHSGSAGRTGDELVVLLRRVEAREHAHGLVHALGVAGPAPVHGLLAAKVEEAVVAHELAPAGALVQLAVVDGEDAELEVALPGRVVLGRGRVAGG